MSKYNSFMPKNLITRSQIKNIGKRLRNANVGENLLADDFIKLNDWRLHHGSSLNYFASLLSEIASEDKLNQTQITVTQRLKRVHSIILKLKRFPEMQLSMMDDIAGSRIVLSDIGDVYKLVDSLKERRSKHKIIKLNRFSVTSHF